MERNIEKRLIEWRDSVDRQPLIVKGARQVGKTYLLSDFGKKHFSNLHYVNFEEYPELRKIFDGNLDTKKILSDLKISYKDVTNNKELIFFDEIQSCPRAITALKYFSENEPNIYICAAGSLLGVALNKESYPVGKVQHFYITPFKFSEFLQACDQWLYEIFKKVKEDLFASDFHHDKLLEAYKLYSAVGGMPIAVLSAKNHYDNHLDLFNELSLKHADLLRSYNSDFAKHAGKVNAVHIASIFANVPSQLSKNVDASTKRYIFKDVLHNKKSFEQLAAPIDWLVKAGLIYKIKVTNRADHPLETFSK
jgi:predicted AAA+ superfamily ATPase